MITPKQALLDLERGKGWPVYFLYGDEPFKISEFADKVRTILFGDQTDSTFCVTRIDGSQATGADVLDAIQSLGLFGGGASRRLVLVRQAHLLKEVDCLTEALANAESKSPWEDSVLLLLAESFDGRRKFHQWLKKNNFVLEFKKAKDAELRQWVHYLAKKIEVSVEPEAVDLLAVLSDGSLYRLSQELEKAWLYLGAKKDQTISAQDVAAISSQNLSYEMIELVQSILEGKRARSLILMERLIQAPEDALGLVGFLTWAIRNPAKIGVGQTGQVDLKIIKGLVDLDFRLKTSGLDSQILVDRFITEQQPVGR